MKRESTIGADVAALVVGAAMALGLSVPMLWLPPSRLGPGGGWFVATVAFMAAFLAGMVLSLHGWRLSYFFVGAAIAGTLASFVRAGTAGTNYLATAVGDFIPLALMGLRPAAFLAISYALGAVTTWAGRGLLGLVKRRSPRQSHQGQQARSREQEASVPAHRASTLSAAKEGVMPATEEVAITRR